MIYKIYWFPQIPCEPFELRMKTPSYAKTVLNALAQYDLFLLENNHRCDFSNAGGLLYYDKDSKEWLDWEDHDGNDIFQTKEVI